MRGATPWLDGIRPHPGCHTRGRHLIGQSHYPLHPPLVATPPAALESHCFVSCPSSVIKEWGDQSGGVRERGEKTTLRAMCPWLLTLLPNDALE